MNPYQTWQENSSYRESVENQRATEPKIVASPAAPPLRTPFAMPAPGGARRGTAQGKMVGARRTGDMAGGTALEVDGGGWRGGAPALQLLAAAAGSPRPSSRQLARIEPPGRRIEFPPPEPIFSLHRARSGAEGGDAG
jgi:hypothetical protein